MDQKDIIKKIGKDILATVCNSILGILEDCDKKKNKENK